MMDAVADVVMKDDEVEAVSLSELFYEAFKEFWDFRKNHFQVVKDDGANRDATLVYTRSLLSKFRRIAVLFSRADLISSNEELDDVNTSTLKFLFVPFAMGELCNAMPGLDGRTEVLQHAMVYWSAFMDRLEQLGPVKFKDVTSWNVTEESESPAERRNQKIERYRRRTALDAQIKEIFSRRKDRYGDEFKWHGVAAGDDEEEERALVILLLQQSALEALEHRDLTRQEIQMLEMRQVAAETKEAPQRVSQERKQLEYFTIGRSTRDQLHMKYLDSVFKPSHILPTMTLAEVAEWEMKYEVDMLGGRGTTKKKVEPDEDDPVYIAFKEKKDRAWDDWKDENPKGWGNKNRSVG
eukprot:Lankesteria_metandrocarpae@DN578_c0_g1_i1.p1